MQADLLRFMDVARPQVVRYVLEAHQELLDEVQRQDHRELSGAGEVDGEAADRRQVAATGGGAASRRPAAPLRRRSRGDRGGGRLLERVHPHHQREQIRVVRLEVLHVEDPLRHEGVVGPADVELEVGFVGGRQAR